MQLGWRRQYCGIFEAHANGVIYYLLDNEYYFKRNSLYGHYDDGERFAFFSRAVLEILPYIDFKPDIIHCNDWQTALIPVYYSTMYAKPISINFQREMLKMNMGNGLKYHIIQ